MSWDSIFPTREGGSAGSSIENRMLGKVSGANTIRTEIRSLPDGSEVMLRTRGGHPEFTVKPAVRAVEALYSNWTWPWHGLLRGSYIETPTGNLMANTYNSGGSGYSFEFRAFKAASNFGTITTPSTGPVTGASWVNWACISRGVLFGRYAGMNTWLFVKGGKSWVAVLSFTTRYTGTITFYTLENWVSSMPLDDAVKFVRYDKTPTPFVTSVRPSGSLRVAAQVVGFTLPAHYLPANSYATLTKMGDMASDGSKVLIEYEEQTAGPYLVPNDGSAVGSMGWSGEQRVVQWAEITVDYTDEVFSVSTSIVKSGAVTPGAVSRTKVAGDTNWVVIPGTTVFADIKAAGVWDSSFVDTTTCAPTIYTLGFCYSLANTLIEITATQTTTYTKTQHIHVASFGDTVVGGSEVEGAIVSWAADTGYIRYDEELVTTTVVSCGGAAVTITRQEEKTTNDDWTARVETIEGSTTITINGVSEVHTSSSSTPQAEGTVMGMNLGSVGTPTEYGLGFRGELITNTVPTLLAPQYTLVSDRNKYTSTGVSRTAVGFEKYYLAATMFQNATFAYRLNAWLGSRMRKLTSNCLIFSLETDEGDTFTGSGGTAYPVLRERIVAHLSPAGAVSENSSVNEPVQTHMAFNIATGAYTKFPYGTGSFPKYV